MNIAAGVPSGIGGMGASLRRTTSPEAMKRRPSRMPAMMGAYFMGAGEYFRRSGGKRKDAETQSSRNGGRGLLRANPAGRDCLRLGRFRLSGWRRGNYGF